jgi:uncharacterized protein YggE
VVVSVEVELSKLSERGKEVITAVEDVLGRSEFQGVWFTHSNCGAILQEARKQALTDARHNAEALATAAGVQLGTLMSVADAAPPPGPLITSNPCTKDVASIAVGSPYGPQIKPLDAKPELTVTAAVALSFAISGR